MKDLKLSLKKLASDLNKASKQVEKLAGKLEAKPAQTTTKRVSKKTAGKPVRTVVKRATRQPAKQPTAVDAVFGIIKRSKKGVNMATIKLKTGYDNRKIHNIAYRLKKQGKIKSEINGVYAKV